MFFHRIIVFTLEIMGYKIEISNLLISSVVYFFICIFLTYEIKKKGFIFAISQKVYEFIENISVENTHSKDHTFLLFFLFVTISITNTIRCFYFPALNSLIALPALFSIIGFFYALFLGLKKKHITFFWNLVPSEIPLLLKPILMIIETIVLFIKPITLTVRLFLNIAVGHIVIHSLHSVADSFGAVGLVTTPIFVGLNFLEIGIGILQAYIFVIFTALLIDSCTNQH